MNVLVAGGAFCRRRLEIGALHPGLWIFRAMALAAGQAPVTAFECKRGLRVVEVQNFQPRIRGVARRAALR